MKLFRLILKNLRRNKVRSSLTALAVMALVVIFSMIFTVLRFLDLAMQAQSKDVLVVITERYRIPSRFDRRLMEQITTPGSLVNQELSQIPGFHAERHNVWHFAVFSTDPEMKDPNKQFFVIATYPEKIKAMIDSMEALDPRLCELMKDPPVGKIANGGVLMGPDRLKQIGKKVGDVFPAKSLSHRAGGPGRQPIEMTFEIVGELPGESRWAQGAFMDYAYLDRVLKETKCEQDGKVNLGWLKLDDQPAADAVGGTIERSIADLKSETGSSAVSRFLDPYVPMLNGVKYGLAPAIIIVMVVIVANAVSISVRERMAEMAVLKVLGFRPPQVFFLVLGEGVLLGAAAGLVAATLTFLLVNARGGIKIPFAFFPTFFVPAHVFWWGPCLGAAAAFAGGLLPAWTARRVKVSEVFSKVA